jgi:hypothetical protein
MSIIFEALKKVEGTKDEQSSPLPHLAFTVDPGESPTITTPARSRRGLLWGLISVALLSSLFALYKTNRPNVTEPARVSPPPQAAPQAPPVVKTLHLAPMEIKPFAATLAYIAPPDTGTSQAPPAEDITLPDLRLKGLTHTNRRSWAFINDKMIKVGDSIEGAEVVAIQDDRVNLIYKGVEFTLTY